MKKEIGFYCMNKKQYLKPQMVLVNLQRETTLLTTSGMRGLNTNLDESDDLDYGGGGTYDAR